MQCPMCANPLAEIDIGSVLVDVCDQGCGGIWFDHRELKKLDELKELDGEKLSHYQCQPGVVVDHSKRLQCPRCTTKVILMRHFFSVKKSVEVDECAKCGGFWLDHGELDRLRGEFRDEAARDAEAKQYFATMFDGKLHEEMKEFDANLSRTHKVASMFRFICPSYYIGGDQDLKDFQRITGIKSEDGKK